MSLSSYIIQVTFCRLPSPSSYRLKIFLAKYLHYTVVSSSLTMLLVAMVPMCSSSHAGGDQGLLNLYWGDWATKDIKYHLPFIYNVVPNVTYGYAPAFQVSR